MWWFRVNHCINDFISFWGVVNFKLKYLWRVKRYQKASIICKRSVYSRQFWLTNCSCYGPSKQRLIFVWDTLYFVLFLQNLPEIKWAQAWKLDVPSLYLMFDANTDTFCHWGMLNLNSSVAIWIEPERDSITWKLSIKGLRLLNSKDIQINLSNNVFCITF